MIFHRLHGFFRRLYLFLPILVLTVGTSGCAGAGASPAAPLLPVTVGMDNTAVNTLILIAQEQGFFTANGLQVTVKNYASGLAATNDMLAGKGVDVATSSEFVLVGDALSAEKIRAWASIDKFMHNYLIARKDRGIAQVADLRGKTIGVSLKTAAEFYLGRFLELQGVELSQVKLVNVDPPNLVGALTGGSVDAVVAWQPNARMLEQKLGSGIVKWPAQSEQAAYGIVTSTPSWMDAHPQGATRFLKALAQAETWYASHLEQTKALLKKRLGYDDGYIAAIWPEHQFQLSLDQSMILAMEDESRWMISHQLTSATQPPSFLDYLSLDGMRAAKPESVNIIQ